MSGRNEKDKWTEESLERLPKCKAARKNPAEPSVGWKETGMVIWIMLLLHIDYRNFYIRF